MVANDFRVVAGLPRAGGVKDFLDLCDGHIG